MMLLEISYNFVNIIGTSVNFLLGAGRASWPFRCLELTNFGLNFFHLALICLVVENVKTKV